MRYGDTDFDLSSPPPGPWPRPADFFTATAMFQAFASALASHTTTCNRCPLPNIGSNLFPILWIVACSPFFSCASSFLCFWVLASFATNGFPGLECGLTRSLTSFRCWTHVRLLL